MRTLLLCLACLGIGVAAGYLLRGPGVNPSRAPVLGPPGPEPATSTAPAPRPTDLQRALDGIPMPDLPKGSGRIVGRVEDEEGQPVAGVEISAQRDAADIMLALPVGDEPDLASKVRRFVTWVRTYDVPASTATSGADGTFALEGLADAGYYVHAWLKGYAVERADGDSRAEFPGAELRFIVRTLVELRVEVVLPDGTQPESARLLLSGRSSASEAEWRRDSPTLRLVPGTYKVQAMVFEGVEQVFKSNEASVVLEPGRPQTVRLASGGSSISGTIGPGAMRPGDSWTVRALRFSGAETPRPERLVAGCPEGHAGSGSYRIEQLAPGRYVVGLLQGFTVLCTKTVELGERPARCDFDLTQCELPLFRVRVLGPDAKAVDDARVTAGTDRAFGGGRTSAGLLQPDGSFLVVDPFKADDGTERVVEAKSARYGEKRASYLGVPPGDVELRFEAPASLTVELTGDDGVEVWVALALSRGVRPRVVVSSRERAEHRLEVGPTQAGVYDLVVLSSFTQAYSVIAVRKEISLAPGRNRVAVDLPRLYRLTVVGAPPRGMLWLHPEGSLRWAPGQKTAGEDGKVVFENLPAGRYTVMFGEDAVAVQLDGSAEVRFEPRPLNALEVQVAGSATALGLRTGDLIIGATGREFGNLDEAKNALRAGAALMVRRDARTAEVQVDAEGLRRALDAGEIAVAPSVR